jgi:hypothetical protein
MAGSREDWARYERWNAAIAETVYSPANAGQPVYLDLEEDLLEVIREQAEPDATNPTSALIDVVKGTLVLVDGASLVLRDHLSRLDRWYQGSMLEPPPTLGLLAMLSLVAENMRQGQDMRAHNFYGRLSELAELDDNQIRWFQLAYRSKRDNGAASAELWDSLNLWLEMMEGSRGLPTAYPLGHDHIGLPLSQALVRQADRDKFSDLFASQGLPPGSSLPTSEMSAQLDEWMSRTPCPASNTLERLWKEQSAARQQIAEVACRTLETWDGVVPEASLRAANHRQIDTVRLKVLVRTFPTRRIDLSMVVPGRATSDVEEVQVLDIDGKPTTTVDMVPVASGWLGISDDQAIDAGSFLDGNVSLLRANQDHALRRRPRRLIPLRWDDLLLAYIECERVQLGEKSLVLSRSEIASRVTSFLTQAARPGFKESSHLPGLPEGWTAFEDVQILLFNQRQTGQLVDLGVLQPLARSQVVLQGGLKLPGHLRKWSSALPPELRVSTDEGTELEVTLSCTRALTNPKPIDDARAGIGPVLIWDLAEANLPDGDYDIQVRTDGDLIQSELLRLRSADNPALQVDDGRDPIANDPAQPAFGLLAGRSSSVSAFKGTVEELGPLISGDPPSTPSWWTARAAARRSSRTVRVVRFPMDPVHSCIATGAHYMDVPRGLDGQRSIEAICRYCGLVKRYPTTYRLRKRKATDAEVLAPALRVKGLPSVRLENDIDWSAAFDAVCHIGSGSIPALGRITAQMEASDLFGDVFERKLDVLGHIEVERSPKTLIGLSWQVNGPIVIGLMTGDLAVIGFRSEKAMVAIEDQVWAEGGELLVNSDVSAPPVLRVKGLDQEGALRLAEAIGAAVGRSAQFIPAAALRLAACLPPLSKARSGLPITSTLSALSYEAWDPVAARFESASDAAAPGVFRLNSHTRAYIYRRTEDLGAMRAVLGDARIVKYLAAMDCGLSLVGYDAESQVLYVPLGADLPGLYGRAAVFASGCPPRENTEERLLEYRRVPPQLAAHLAHLLMS